MQKRVLGCIFGHNAKKRCKVKGSLLKRLKANNFYSFGSIDGLNGRACFHRPIKQDVFCISKQSGKWTKAEMSKMDHHSIDLNVIRDVEINPLTSQVIGLQISCFFVGQKLTLLILKLKLLFKLIILSNIT